MKQRWARCRKVQPLLALAASQDLGERASRRVWSHLAECMDCRRRYTGYLELRSALTDLDPLRPDSMRSGTSRAGRADNSFFEELQDDILNEVEKRSVASRARRAWVGSASAAALFLVGALTIQGLLPQGDGLLYREPMEPMAPAPFTPDFGTTVIPLSHPQGLGARRQIDLLFEEEAGFEVTPASYGLASYRGR